MPDHVLGDRRLGDLEPELQQFTMDARRAPQWILLAHPSDEFAQLRFDFGPARLTAGFPAPIGPKPCSMPPQDCIRLNDTGQIEQAWPDRVIHTIRARSLPCSRRRSRRRYGARLKQGTPAADADPLDETLAPCPKVWLYGGRQARSSCCDTGDVR